MQTEASLTVQDDLHGLIENIPRSGRWEGVVSKVQFCLWLSPDGNSNSRDVLLLHISRASRSFYPLMR